MTKPLAAEKAFTLQTATKKATRRLVPLLAILLFVNYLDRVNVGFAAPRMNEDLDMTALGYGLGVALFFVGYIILEIPSNYFMYKLGARLWLARILISWGIIAALHLAIVGPTTFAGARVLLGIAEAGFLPGILLYFTLWFPVRVRAAVMGLYYIAVPLSTALGGPLSEWLMVVGDGMFGLSGWRFMFLVEGALAIILGIVVLFILPARPRDARWLNLSERTAIEDAVAADDNVLTHRSHSFVSAFRDRRVLVLSAMFILLVFPMFAITFFLPLIVTGMQQVTGTLNSVQMALVPFVPFSLGALASWRWSARNRNREQRAWHFAVPITLAGLAVIVCAFASGSIWVLMAAVSLASIGIYAAIPIFWGLTGRFVVGAAAAAGLALINSIGSVGGFVAGYLTGWLRDLTGAYTLAFVIMGCCLILSGAIAVAYFNRTRLAWNATTNSARNTVLTETPL